MFPYTPVGHNLDPLYGAQLLVCHSSAAAYVDSQRYTYFPPSIMYFGQELTPR